MPTRVDKQTGNCGECQGGLTCMHCHPESAPMDRHRIAELETLISAIVLANGGKYTIDGLSLLAAKRAKITWEKNVMSLDTVITVTEE